MTWNAPAVERQDPNTTNGERAALEDWLRLHRETLLMKCALLDSDQLKTASVEPSKLTCSG
jgi:hypothetical protein